MSNTPESLRSHLEVTAVGEHLQHYIRYGVPEIGWDGDPWLTLAYNKLEDRYEIWQEDPGREPVCVMRSKPFHTNGVPDIHELCIKLRDHDLRKLATHQIEKRVDDANYKRQMEVQEYEKERQYEALHRVAWEIGRAEGDYRPVITMGS